MNTTASPDGRILLHHRRQARMARAKGMLHLVPAVVLLSGVAGLLGGQEPFTPLLAAEMAVGLAYVLLLVRELRHLRRDPHHHEAVAWLELAAAGILAIEGYHIWHRHHEAALRTGEHRFRPLPYLYWAVALVYVGLALGAARLARRRFLHLHAGGFSVRLHPLTRRRDFRWEDISRLEATGETAVLIHRPVGRPQRLDFRAIHQGAEIRARLLAHAAQRHG